MEKYIKWKIIGVVLGLLLFLCSFFAYSNHRHHQDYLEANIARYDAEIEHIFEQEVKETVEPFKVMLLSFLENEDIINAFAQKDVVNLQALVNPLFLELKRNDEHLKSLHFHLPDGSVFLELEHTSELPYVSSKKNHSFDHFHENPISDFHVAIHGGLYRVEYPVIIGDEYYGLVEFGVSLDAFTTAISEQVSNSNAIYIRKDTFDLTDGDSWAGLKGKEIGNYILVEYDSYIDSLPITQDNLLIDNQIVEIDEKFLIFHSENLIKDYKDKIIGGVFAVQDITEDVFYAKEHRTKFLIVLGVLSFVLILLTYFFVSKIMKSFEEEISKRENLEGNYQSLLANAGTGVWQFDFNFNTVYLNTAMYRILGLDNDVSFSDIDFSSFFSTENLEKIEETLEKLKLDGEADYRLRIPIRISNGETKILVFSFSFASDSSNNNDTFLAMCLDITKQENAKKELKESEVKFRTLMKVMQVGVFLHENTIPVFINDKILEMTGYDREEVLHKSFLNIVHPEHREMVIEYSQARLRGEPVPNNYDVKFMRKDGSFRWGRIEAELFKVGDKDLNAVTLADVTDQKMALEASKKAEMKYRDIFENSVEGLFQTTPDGEFRVVNPSMAFILGYDGPEEILNTIRVQDIYVNVQDRQELTQELDAKGVIRAHEVRMRRKDKSELWASISARAIKNQRGEVQYYEGSLVDITDVVTLSEEIINTQKEVIVTLGEVVENRSKESAFHVQRVAEYSYLLAKKYGLPEKEAEMLRYASPMHDVGKIGINDSILLKPGKLTAEEFDVMKTHASIGYEILSKSNREIMKAAAIVANEHHERWDGNGYPRGLKGEEIHIYGRITAIADVFDALSSERVYKKAFPMDKVIKIMSEGATGGQFDRRLFQIFLDNLDLFLEIKDKYSDTPEEIL